MIFIVDDDRSVRTSLTRLMRSAGYEARAFAGAEGYLDNVGEATGTAADCVILDLQLPGMSGLELQEVINRREFPVPVIVLTASEDAELRAKALVAGAAKVLKKPCDAAVLLGAVADATGQSPPSSPLASQPAQTTTRSAELGSKRGGMDDPDTFVLEEGRGLYCPVGSVSFDQAVALVRAAIAAARRNQVRDLLVDTTALTGFPSPDTFERFLAAVEWADAARAGVRLAMVARAEMIDPQKFGVIVAANRGLVSNIFTTEVEARAWLGARDRQ
jgi:FixJ family two-component response regulator